MKKKAIFWLGLLSLILLLTVIKFFQNHGESVFLLLLLFMILGASSWFVWNIFGMFSMSLENPYVISAVILAFLIYVFGVAISIIKLRDSNKSYPYYLIGGLLGFLFWPLVSFLIGWFDSLPLVIPSALISTALGLLLAGVYCRFIK